MVPKRDRLVRYTATTHPNFAGGPADQTRLNDFAAALVLLHGHRPNDVTLFSVKLTASSRGVSTGHGIKCSSFDTGREGLVISYVVRLSDSVPQRPGSLHGESRSVSEPVDTHRRFLLRTRSKSGAAGK